MDNLLMEIEKSMHQRSSLSVLNNGGFGYNSLHNYSINPSINSSINQPLLKNPNTNIMSPNFLRGSLPIISPPHFHSSTLPPNHHHHNQPPLLPLPRRSSTPPSTNKKRKKKRQQQQQQQLKPNHSNITIPKPETKAEDTVKPTTERMEKKEEEEEDTEEEFLIVGSLSAVTSVYTSISPPPPSSVPMPRLLLKPKTNSVGSCNAEALDSAGATDDLRKLLRL